MNEKTSKRVASAASDIMREADSMIDELLTMQATIKRTIALLRKAERVSASALTQANDK